MSEGNGKNLPPGWTWATVADVAELIQYGHTASAVENPKGPRFLRITDIQDGAVDWAKVPSCKISPSDVPRFELQSGDIVFARTGATTGKSFLIHACPYAVFASYLIRLRMHDGIAPQFLQAFFQTNDYWRQIERQRRGIGQPNVNGSVLGTIRVPVAPADEQSRITDILDELLSDLDAGVKALERARQKLRQYRAAVLKAAVEGTLTSEWRKAHPDVEPASECLKRILAERRRRWEQFQLKKYKDAGKEPPKNWKAKYKNPAIPDTAHLRDLPGGWAWATPYALGDVQLGRQRAPQHHSGAHMRPYLRVANVYEGRIDLGSVYEMNFTPEEYESYRLEPRDILLNEGQSLELVGRSAIYRGEVPGACFTNTLVRFRPADGVVTEFAQTYFTACLRAHRFQKIARWTVNIAHLGADRFAEMEFPLPPYAEQQAIVEGVEDQLSVIDHLETDLETKLKSAAALRQSILKAAFEGKLAPQDPNDEPATELLKRIAAKRAERDACRRERGRPRSRRTFEERSAGKTQTS